MGNRDDLTVKDLIKMCKDSNAGILRMVFKELDDTPTGAVIILDGKETTQEILALIDTVEKEWETYAETGAISSAGVIFEDGKFKEGSINIKQ